ncbi:MAG: thermonuclease family protein [Sphingomonas bacterium]|nr:thermonuclease family protein [Sphingomonas bacterium]
MKHFRPDPVVRIAMSRRERRRMRRMFDALETRGRPVRRGRRSGTTVVVLTAAAFAGLAAGLGVRGGPPVLAATEIPAHIPFFGYCKFGGGTNCVVDGDTFYFGRAKVRIAGIDAPETHPPRCATEARLGDVATHRLRDLLNSGEITLSSIDRDEDVYGRKLRNVSVGGADVGAALIGEGLARDYAGGRRPWC